jgi:hypothetical protein
LLFVSDSFPLVQIHVVKKKFCFVLLHAQFKLGVMDHDNTIIELLSLIKHDTMKAYWVVDV